jgi:predicted nucleic acid-binding Zn ribbon protein
MKKSHSIKISAMFLLVIALVSFASAISVSRDYLENNQMNMTLGQTKNIDFVLQNGGATDPTNIKVTILEGSEILSLLDENNIYLVNPGDKIPVHFQVSIPEDAEWGSEYPVKVEFTEVSLNENTLSIGTGIEQNFKIKVEKTQEILEKEKQRKNNLLLLGIGILIILILIIIVVVVKKRKSR